ncbi:hypothetical protein VTH06DRAFT_6404 [Thermothelomyces fergusii]
MPLIDVYFYLVLQTLLTA